jgi:predicted RNA-binding Zn-ribbon protein involved in translation (DUF1610 family)
MIVPLFSPNNTDLTTWAAQCDRCGLQQPIDKTVDWTLTEEEADVHYCPACTKRIARHLIGSATPRRSPLGLALTALIVIPRLFGH